MTLAPLFLLLAAPQARGQHTPAVFDLATEREPVVSLDSEWRFHPGDNSQWSDPAYDDSAWRLLRSDEPWSDQGYAGMSGYGWYRFTVHVPARSASSRDEKLAVELAPIMTTYQLFFDGRMAGQVGSAPGATIPTANWNHAIFPLPETLSNEPRTVHVAIRVWHSPIWASYIGGGPWAGGNRLGSEAILRQQQRAHWDARRLLFVDLFCYAIAATIVGLTIFWLFLFRPREREYLWFALLLLAKAVDSALNISKELYAAPSVPIFDLLDALCIAIAQAALLLFLSNVLRLGQQRLRIALLTLIALSPWLSVLYWPGWTSVPVSASLQILCLLPSSVWVLTVLATGAARRDETARLLLVPVFLVQGLWILNNILLALVQYGRLNDDFLLESPFILAPYRIHPSVLAELVFLLAMLIFLIRRFTAGRQREERFENELEAARQVQQLVLPAHVEAIPGFALECIYYPADRVGGDFFQVLPAADGGLFIVAGDVAGKGLPAALIVSMLVGAIRAEAPHATSPNALLAALNRSLCGHSHGRFTTCLCLLISADGAVHAASAGHPAPYRNGVEVAIDPALPLGIVREWGCAETRLQLTPGEHLTLVSDGVLEAQSRAGELFGFERTAAISHKGAAEIAETARSFGQNDDITVLTITWLGVEAMPALTSQTSA
ncbi:MAG TPA: PP2C family protein-serine/threonine phosphatase [Acidobacteriaceae bacterium]|nr:PP2C family protein-serine/threonine phosphatase [Acidobacteriaceae bacterium]